MRKEVTEDAVLYVCMCVHVCVSSYVLVLLQLSYTQPSEDHALYNE